MGLTWVLGFIGLDIVWFVWRNWNWCSLVWEKLYCCVPSDGRLVGTRVGQGNKKGGTKVETLVDAVSGASSWDIELW